VPRKLHMMTGAIYETISEGVARVTTPDGRSGRFDDTGKWLEGELREADPLLCLWVAGRQLPAGMAANTKDLPLETVVKGRETSS
jgi:hypothetical protein